MTLRFHTLLVISLGLALGSCSNNKPLETYPSTEVEVDIQKNIASIDQLLSDSTNFSEEYWLGANGEYLYKISHSPYKNGRLHGTRIIWNEYGDTLELSHWSDGVQQDSSIFRYKKYPWQVRQLVHYTSSGNKEFEVYYHPNGSKRTDTIYYEKGKREGNIHFYNDKGQQTETYFFKNDRLVGVDLYRELYQRQERLSRQLTTAQQASMLDAAIEIDTTGMVVAKNPDELDSLKQISKTIDPNANKNVIRLDATVNETYKGNTKNKNDAVW
ncbi:MAG: hypothetical protein MK212_04220 [Saprospiraceae bacterium]|nr:hypothetical protein [Saprospiraceae bacterium]